MEEKGKGKEEKDNSWLIVQVGFCIAVIVATIVVCYLVNQWAENVVANSEPLIGASPQDFAYARLENNTSTTFLGHTYTAYYEYRTLYAFSENPTMVRMVGPDGNDSIYIRWDYYSRYLVAFHNQSTLDGYLYNNISGNDRLYTEPIGPLYSPPWLPNIKENTMQPTIQPSDFTNITFTDPEGNVLRAEQDPNNSNMYWVYTNVPMNGTEIRVSYRGAS